MTNEIDILALAGRLAPIMAASLLGRSHNGYDYDRLGEVAASIDSSNFAVENFKRAMRFPTDEALLRHAVTTARTDGLFLEFGVASGRTLRIIADAHAGKVYGFDGFNGLPEDWRPGYPAGSFAQQPPEIPENAELVIGWFDKTLPHFVVHHQKPVSFLHIDCDLYSSTKTILHWLKDAIVPGTVIVFDEFLNYPGWRAHEYKAWNEFVAQQSLNFSYVGCVPSHQQVAVLVEAAK
ncbi:MAG TPA: class I SAM-dependent methyltransferase [Acidocella sp.]|nr:class I SAM-dependent methyltransferase [Acidocella sp.]